MRLASRVLIPIVLCGALACGDSAPTTDSGDETGDGDPITLQGAVQKGPLIVGSSVQVSTIDAVGASTGDVYTTQTINDRGEFELDSIPQGDIFIEGEGYYFNELTGEVSGSSLTLRAYHRLDEDSNTVVLNLLTQLTSARIVALLEDGSEFGAAVMQSETEVREAMGVGVPAGALDPMIELDLMGAPEFGNAYLLAVSAVFIQAAVTLAGDQGSVDGELQQLINTLTLELDDGQLPMSTRDMLQQAETALDPALVEANLATRATELGLDGPLPDIDVALDQDHDTVANFDDNCLLTANSDQLDVDDDGIGDLCDNCPDLANPTQDDGDDNGLGDVCDAPEAPVLELGVSPIKQFDFSWMPAAGAEYYQLLESANTGEPLLQLGGDVMGLMTSLTGVPLHLRLNASYVLRACNAYGCTDSAALDVDGPMTDAIGYFKASNPGIEDLFGSSVALSADGTTLAVAAIGESSVNMGTQADDSAPGAGAVYVFVRDGQDQWSQQAYIKASNVGAGDQFGSGLALSADGNTMAVGAYGERSSATGIGGDETDNSLMNAGAVYVLVRDGQGAWTQEAYVKASNTGAVDLFGFSVALSGDGNTMAVGAVAEHSNATGIGGNQADDSSPDAGAVYVFVRDGQSVWSQEEYIKASNTDLGDQFGHRVALSDDGNTLAVSAPYEGSDVGAVYVFVRDGQSAWTQEAYVKASNAGNGDNFGYSVALSDDGDTLSVGAPSDNSVTGAVYVFARAAQVWSQEANIKAPNARVSDAFGTTVALSADGNIMAVGSAESSGAIGLGGDETDNSLPFSGAVYVLARDGQGVWVHQAYVKSSNPAMQDEFGVGAVGVTVALSDDATIMCVAAYAEDSGATGIGGDQTDDSVSNSGAVYVY